MFSYCMTLFNILDVGQHFHNILNIGYYLISFIFIMSIVVFVHEYGHYIVAKLCKVKIEVFSIGFGKELFGFYDRSGTRWKFSYIPAGGYVKMFGDANEVSVEDKDLLESMSDEDKKSSFHYKPLYQRALVVFAGPFANFLLAILILMSLYLFNGKEYVAPIISEVIEGSPADYAGLKAGDEIISIAGEKIKTFNDVVRVMSVNVDSEVMVSYVRGGQNFLVKLFPDNVIAEDIFGDQIKSQYIGIRSGIVEHQSLSIFQSFVGSVVEVKNIIKLTCIELWHMFIGKSDLDKLGGPLKIAKYSGQSMEKGLIFVLWFIAMISINLGFVNLLPIPILDGGHLLCYLIEAVSNKDFAVRYQYYAVKAGMMLIFAIIAFTTFNDVRTIFS